MKVQSKFLNGDVRVTSIKPNGDSIRVEGTIKELYPIEVELSATDLIEILQVSFRPELWLHSAKLLAGGILQPGKSRQQPQP